MASAPTWWPSSSWRSSLPVPVTSTTSPDTAWGWLEQGWALFPEALDDRVSWSYAPMSPWHVAYTTGVRPIDVDIAGEPALRQGVPIRVDAGEIRAKASEQAARLHARPQVTTTVVPTSANAQRNAASRLC